MATYYVAPNGDDSSGDGTYINPWFTIRKFWTVAAAGDGLYMRGGTYEYTRDQYLDGVSGTVGNLVYVYNYPNEVPVITKAAGYSFVDRRVGIYVTGDYLHFKGLTITGFTQITAHFWGGMRADGCSHCTFEELNIYDNGHGFALVGDAGPCDDNDVINCDFHHNYDPITDRDPYGNADGFGIENITDTSYENRLTGCRSWSNSDDGFDCWASNCMVIFDSCWSFWNGWREDGVTSGGNGEGFKFGDTDDHHLVHLRTVQNCLAFENKEGGFSASGVFAIIHAYNNTAYWNSLVNGEWNLGFEFSSDAAHGVHVLRNNVSYATQYWGATHPASIDANFLNCTQDHNSWEADGSNVIVTDGDFLSVDSTGVDGARVNGSLPDLDFLKLAGTSDLVGAGVDVGLTTDGAGNAYNAPPSIGAYEVESAIIPVTAVTVTGTAGATTISVDDGTLQMLAHIDPHNATDQTVTWSVINGTGSATISATGLLTAVSNGTVTVVATANG